MGIKTLRRRCFQLVYIYCIKHILIFSCLHHALALAFNFRTPTTSSPLSLANCASTILPIFPPSIVTPPLKNSTITLPFTTVSSTTPSTFSGPTRPYHIPVPLSAFPSRLGGRYTITLPAYLCPPIWLICATSASMPLRWNSVRNADCSMGPRIPQRWSRPPWPQIRTTGFVMGSGGGSLLAAASSRRSFAFWDEDRPSCMGCRVRAFRYAVAKSRHASGVCGIAGMRLNAGKRSAVVVFGVALTGSEDAVMMTLWNGYRSPSISMLI
jgi:hypothetical protein